MRAYSIMHGHRHTEFQVGVCTVKAVSVCVCVCLTVCVINYVHRGRRPCMPTSLHTHTHTHTVMQMLAKPLRDGWAVNKKWHDMIPTAGTNQTACQSLLTFTKTPERCRSPWWWCWRGRLPVSHSVSLFVYKSGQKVCLRLRLFLRLCSDPI